MMKTAVLSKARTRTRTKMRLTLITLTAFFSAAPAQAFLVAVRDNNMIGKTIEVVEAAEENIKLAQKLGKQSKKMGKAIASGDRKAMASAFGEMSGTLVKMYGEINTIAAVGGMSGIPGAAIEEFEAMSNLIEVAGGADFQNPDDLADVLGATQEAGIDLPVLGELDPDTMLDLYKTTRNGLEKSKNGRFLDTLKFADDLVNFPYEETGIQQAAQDIGVGAAATMNFFKEFLGIDPEDTIEEIEVKAMRRRAFQQKSALRAMGQAAAAAHAISDQARAQEVFHELISDSEDIRTDMVVMNHLLLHLARVQSQQQVVMAEIANMASMKEMTHVSRGQKVKEAISKSRK